MELTATFLIRIIVMKGEKMIPIWNPLFGRFLKYWENQRKEGEALRAAKKQNELKEFRQRIEIQAVKHLTEIDSLVRNYQPNTATKWGRQ